MNIGKHWKSIGIFSSIMAMGILASCARQLATVPVVPATATFTPTITHSPTFTKTNTPAGPTNTFTNTPTATFSNTPCGYPGNTCTFTLTPTSTYTPVGPTATPTGTPSNAIVFENWEGPYPSGNMWASFATCSNASYISNPFASNAAITTCYDSTGGDPHIGTYCWRGIIQWTADAGQAQFGLDSAYGGDYGYPINIAATSPSYISVWVKSDTAPTQFVFYFQDSSSISSGSPANTVYYQNNTGLNAMLTIPTANTWTNFTIPLTAGVGMWSVDPTTLHWTSILDIGTVFQGPTGASYPAIQNVYFDDYYFYP